MIIEKDLVLHPKLTGEFTLEVYHGEETVPYKTLSKTNTVCINGLISIANNTKFYGNKLQGGSSYNGDFINECTVSTNTTEVTKADTAIGGTRYSTTTKSKKTIVDLGDHVYRIDTWFNFGLGAINTTVHKVAISAGNVIYSGTLIRDSEGVLAPLTLTTSDRLVVKYSFTIDLSSLVGTDTVNVTIGGVPTTVTVVREPIKFSEHGNYQFLQYIPSTPYNGVSSSIVWNGECWLSSYSGFITGTVVNGRYYKYSSGTLPKLNQVVTFAPLNPLISSTISGFFNPGMSVPTLKLSLTKLSKNTTDNYYFEESTTDVTFDPPLVLSTDTYIAFSYNYIWDYQ